MNNMNNKTCDLNCKFPGWKSVFVVGIFMILFTIGDAFGDIRVDITRELPFKTQNIVHQFDDYDAFAMWMELKLEKECDPYVTHIEIDLDYIPD